MDENEITISREQYDRLLISDAVLSALIEAGIYKSQEYQEVLESFRKELDSGE